MNGAQIPDPFGRLIDALKPWLHQVVVVGGGRIGSIAFTRMLKLSIIRR
jgi:hypothetical protein